MKRIKTGLTGFILGDWLGMPYRGKGKGTFKPIWTKSYLRGDKCSGNTSMLLCALDSRCNLELYQQNLRNWYFNRKYTGENIEFDIDQVTQKAIMKNFRGVSSDSNSGNRSLMGCCVLAFSPLSKEEIFSLLNSTCKCNRILINNLFKFFVWREVSQSFTRSIIEFILNPLNLFVGYLTKVLTLWDLLLDKPVGVFIGTTFP